MQTRATVGPAVGSICRLPLDAIDASASVLEAAQEMCYKRVGALAVLDKHVLLGVISEADVISAVAERSPLETTSVRTYMTEDPVTVTVTDDAGLAARRMLNHDIGHLPVMDSGTVVGMISRGDLLAIGAVPNPFRTQE